MNSLFFMSLVFDIDPIEFLYSGVSYHVVDRTQFQPFGKNISEFLLQHIRDLSFWDVKSDH